ncbi:peptidase domain-containing ABC transporter [Brumimicrobium aurantiacum]|uniref:ABC transporter ATP-binding protein n=1 Tax=Brumimicrobium aurantiacum TaxID=1737063 RepID=A0A3E1EVG6_9FLAO|nr:ABC transporter ATP-binding protein [Brumimicrobium aurantiacum]RFC53549.1 ABC transporter ATP-binding protein [Brumimicrobium aurantiacum]
MSEKLSKTARFWRLIKSDAKEIRNVYYYSFFVGLIGLSLPLGIQAIINLIQGGRISSAWVVMVVVVVLGVAFSGVLQILQLRVTENIQQRIFTRAAFEFSYRIPKVKLEKLFYNYAPELINRFFDVMTIQKGLSKLIITISTAGIQVILGLLLLSLYHPFFIIFSFALILILFLIFKFTGKKGLDTSIKESHHKYKLAHWLEEIGRASISFKLAGDSIYNLDRTNIHADNYINAREKHFKVLISQYSLLVIFKILVATGLLAIGGMLVMEQQMNIGQFVAAEIIIVMIINSVEKLIRNLDVVYDVITAVEKVAEVTDLDLENTDGLDLDESCNGKGLIVKMNDVTFKYPHSKFTTINNISLDVKENQSVVITGSNGSGKSTLLHLIAGLYDLERGTISYNNLPLGNLNLDSLRNVIGASLNSEDLFYGTIQENITMGRSKASFANVEWVIEKVGLSDFIQQLPNGYNTLIFPNGKTLPKSVVQKLLIARSIVDKPKLLLLEYSLEHLNFPDKMKIMDFIYDKSNNWTVIAISKDLEVARKSDNVIIMNEGRITAQGTYDELEVELNKL